MLALWRSRQAAEDPAPQLDVVAAALGDVVRVMRDAGQSGAREAYKATDPAGQAAATFGLSRATPAVAQILDLVDDNAAVGVLEQAPYGEEVRQRGRTCATPAPAR